MNERREPAGFGYSDGGREDWTFFDAYKVTGEGASIARPDWREFHHVTEDTKRRDATLLSKKQGRPDLLEQTEHGPDAFAFENFLMTQAQRHGWFGGELVPATEYDDWVSGVDAVVEWPRERGESPIRLAVDFTVATDDRTFFKKSDKLEGNVLVKYFRSQIERDEKGDPMEQRVSMPIVLLGFDRDVFLHIARTHETIGRDHPLRRFLLEQATMQIGMQLARLREQLESSRLFKQGSSFADSLRKRSTRVQQRYADLARLEQRINDELQQARQVSLSPEWERIAARSKTHRILSDT